ncbi:MAG: hypothetical protein KF688_17770 [Pirellulales bacterium]|nr:hypothetical protein [Pirellulales bacterium]
MNLESGTTSVVRTNIGRPATCRVRFGATAAIVAALLAAVGCGDGKRLAAVEGTVTKGGVPQKGLWVRYTPAAGGRPGNGRTDDKGRYEIKYTSKAKGAHVGANKVTIGTGGEIDDRGNELNAPQELFAKEVQVADGANVLDFDLADP